MGTLIGLAIRDPIDGAMIESAPVVTPAPPYPLPSVAVIMSLMSSENRKTKIENSIPLPQFPHQPLPYHGPPREQVLADRQTYLAPSLMHVYESPLMIVEGHMQYVWDDAGTRYLDAYGGIVSISAGHCHPKITAKTSAQLATLTHATTIYLHPAAPAFAKKLAAHHTEDSGLKTTLFTNSGSEANEVAFLLAREFTGRFDIISLRNGYHGGTSGTMGATGTGTWRYPSNISANNKFATPGYCYRCPFGLAYPACDVRCARDTDNLIRYETAGQVAAFIAEPIQGVGGVIVPPKEYFQIQYDIVRRHGGLCIADEVQTGFGRTGEHFWGFQNFGVTPDIVTMAKGIGNGFPLGATTTRPDIAAALKNKNHFNTFAGNPLAMTQGLATLETIDEDHLQQNAQLVGTYLKEKLLDLQQKHVPIGEVRGLGLMLGVELVTDRQTKEPSTRQAARLLELARQRRLLLGKGGLHGNVVRIKPPLCITKDDADFLIAVLDECLSLLVAADH
jgi:alanine-glyoxylate transaminase / (R)-3-amino-2-methylpropionate-pyruvate transaminase